MKTAKYLLTTAIGLVVLLGPRPVWADAIVDVTISNLTINGNSVCGGSVCSEVVSLSFVWDNTTGSALAVSQLPVPSDPLPPFTFGLPMLVGHGTPPFQSFTVEGGGTNGNGDMIFYGFDINSANLPTGTFPLGVSSLGNFSGGLLCNVAQSTAPCTLDFTSSTIPFGPFAASGTATVTPAPVPEPPAAILLVTGLLGLLAAAHRRLLGVN